VFLKACNKARALVVRPLAATHWVQRGVQAKSRRGWFCFAVPRSFCAGDDWAAGPVRAPKPGFAQALVPGRAGRGRSYGLVWGVRSPSWSICALWDALPALLCNSSAPPPQTEPTSAIGQSQVPITCQWHHTSRGLNHFAAHLRLPGSSRIQGVCCFLRARHFLDTL